MAPEEIQNIIVSLNKSIELFTAQLEAVVIGIPKNKESNNSTPSIIKGDDQIESLKNTNERNGGIGPSDVKFIEELHKKFKPLFDELKVKSSPEPAADATKERNDGVSLNDTKFLDDLHKKIKPLFEEVRRKPISEFITQKIDAVVAPKEDETEKNNKVSVVSIIDNLFKNIKPLFGEVKAKPSPEIKTEESDVAEVLKGEEVEKITKVSIVNISDEALKSLSAAIKGNANAPAKDGKEGGGILSGIAGLLGGTGVAAAGSGLLAFLTALPAAMPGIAVALGTIVAGAAAVSAAIAIVVKTMSYLKDDLIQIFPAIKNFAKLFVEVAVEVIPVLYKALADLVATVIPAIINAFKEFASVVIPAVIKAITSLIDSPGFKFLIGAFATALIQTFKAVGNVLTTIAETIKSIFTGVTDALMSLFKNIKDIVVPVVTSIKDMFITLVESIKGIYVGLFESIETAIVTISNNIKETISTIGSLVRDTLLGALDKIDSLFTKLPMIIGSVLGKIKDFANEIAGGKIGAIAGEVTELAKSLALLTGSSLLSTISEFFTKNPFDKIIEFQNKIDVERLSILSTLVPNLQKLADVNADQLKGVGSLIDELVGKSMQVSATVEKIFSGESSWFKKSGGILEIIDKLESAKQGAENTVTSIIVKTSDAHRKISEQQLNETKMTNRILSDIFKKMNTMSINALSNAPAPESTGINRDARMPLQFTSTNTRQQMLQSGAVI